MFKRNKIKQLRKNELMLSYEYLWVKRVIISCKTVEQLHVADNLIIALSNKYKNRVTDYFLIRIIDILDRICYQKILSV